MDSTRYRARFLIAMGLASSAACSKESARPESVPTGSATATPSASASATTLTTTDTTASAQPSATPSAEPSSTAGTTPSATPSSVLGVPKPTPFGPGYSCGFEVTCLPKTSGKCAPSYTEPKDAGPDPRTGELYAEALQANPGNCCYKLSRRFCGGGRPLRAIDDEPIVATMFTDLEKWTSIDPFVARWVREAAFEHASVASFARVSLQLLALGAPLDLLEATQRAALDEIEHARTFLALAKRRGGAERRLGPLAVDRAPLATSFESFVTDTFLDGCVAETISGIEIRSCADDGDDFERSAVAKIADEEDRHAELAWRMLAWAVRAGGPSARKALEEAIGRIDHEHPIVRDVVLPCARALSTKVSADEHRSSPGA